VTVAGALLERPDSRPAAWWGMLMLVASEATLFLAFIATYYYLRFTSVTWPQGGIEKPRVVVPLLMVLLLASTSISMQLAWRSARARRLALTRLLLVWALLVQLAYLIWAVHDYRHQLELFTPQTNAYGSIYYVLLGADHAHVVVGGILVLWLLAKLVGGFTRYRVNAVHGIAWYWHAVNLLTVVVGLVIASGAL
jgi:heme/copper-type cytochrome/quinol oxidase subunit 3